MASLGPFLLTSPARTLADILLNSPFEVGVAALDAALRTKTVTRTDVADAVETSARSFGRSTALRVLAFADPGAANPGESLSRVRIVQLGFTVPTLQQPFKDDRGLIGVTDCWWKESGVVGEFDGYQKYSKPEYLRGRTPSRVVVEERARERRLEALPEVRRVARWVWADLERPERLFRELTAAGVPRA